MLKIVILNVDIQGESSLQSESHKSESEDIDGVEIEEDIEEHIMIDSSEGPTPCKMARKQTEIEECDGSSTEVDVEGKPYV